METIFLDTKNERHAAHLIHEEKEYFIAYVFSTNDIIIGNPETNILMDGNIRLIHCHDHSRNLSDLFDSNGKFDWDLIYYYFKNTKPIVSYLKLAKLIFL